MIIDFNGNRMVDPDDIAIGIALMEDEEAAKEEKEYDENDI